MRAAVCLALLVVGCGAPPIPLRYRPTHVDESLGQAPYEALAEWQLATGGRYPERHISFFEGDPGEGRVGSSNPVGNVEDGRYDVVVRAGIGWELTRKVLLHELGHVARLLPDPEHPQPTHWHGAAPSVMRDWVFDCSDEIGAPELAAFDRQYGR